MPKRKYHMSPKSQLLVPCAANKKPCPHGDAIHVEAGSLTEAYRKYEETKTSKETTVSLERKPPVGSSQVVVNPLLRSQPVEKKVYSAAEAYETGDFTNLPEPEGLHPEYSDWRKNALADGWIEKPGGPWGPQAQPHLRDDVFGQFQTTGERRPGDRAILLKKDDWSVWLVDRDLSDINQKPTGKRELYTISWYDNGQSNSGPVPEKYSIEDLEKLRNKCNYCGSTDKPVKHIGFAGKVCGDCDTPELRNKVEFPGWAD